MANGSVFVPAVIEVGLVTWKGILNGTTKDAPIPHLPLPSTYISVAIIYGILALPSGELARVATWVGWGYVIATALTLPGAKSSRVASPSTAQGAAA